MSTTKDSMSQDDHKMDLKMDLTFRLPLELHPDQCSAEKLRQRCEKEELENAGGDNVHYWALQIIANLELEDLLATKFLWKRIPDDKKADPTLKALMEVARAVKLQNPQKFFQQIQTVGNEELKPWVEDLSMKVKQQFQRLITNSYDSISLEKCAQFFNMSKEECQQHVTSELKWEVKENMVTVKTPPLERDQTTSLQQLKQLSKYVMHLERKLS